MRECGMMRMDVFTFNGTMRHLFDEAGLKKLANNGSSIRSERNKGYFEYVNPDGDKKYVRPGLAEPDMTMTDYEVEVLWRNVVVQSKSDVKDKKVNRDIPPLRRD
jgi:hypothetical protein